MKIVKGKHSEAKVFTDVVEDAAIQQVKEMCDLEFLRDSKIRMMPDLHAGKGCTIGTTMVIKDKVVPNFVGVDVGCLDKDTEFLTHGGWKKINTYSDDDLVLQYNKETDTANFVKPTNYIVKNCDKFFHFKNERGLDQMICEEHKVLVWKGFKGRGYKLEDFKTVELIELGNRLDKGYYGVKASFNIENGKGLSMTDDEIRLDIMISADGSIKYQREGEHQIYLHLKKERKINRAKQLLEKNGIEYKETMGKSGSTHIYFFVDKRFNKNLSKYWRANKRQLKVLSDESLMWDGYKGYRQYFSSTDKLNADIVQFAFSSNNVRAGISEVDYGSKGWSTSYVVTPTKNNIIGITNDISIVEPTDKKKYCFTVPSGYFVARRNGKIFITGNCGILTVQIKEKEIEFEKLDQVINKFVPSGNRIHDQPYSEYGTIDIERFKARHVLSKKRTNKSLGTLGGGNHYIEVSTDEDSNLYLTIHTGSRYLGARIANHYQKVAYDNLTKIDSKDIIKQLKSEGRHKEIQATIEQLQKELPNHNIDKDLAYLEGESLHDYLHDMKLSQRYAQDNRLMIASIIFDNMGWNKDVVDMFDTAHNYIDVENMILRKGAVSAQEGERLIIPINMRDGSIICVGKGNEDWNYSAPHGAGRVLSRSKARQNLDLREFESQMSDVWTSSVGIETLDEAPDAYKRKEDIVNNIGDTVDIVKHLTPVYNFKAKEELKFWEKKS